MTEHLSLLTKFQQAQRAIDDLAEEAHRVAREHLHALDATREELCAIDALVRPIVGEGPNGSLDLVRALIAEPSASRTAHTQALQEVARLTDAERLLREAHVKAVADRDHQWQAWSAAVGREQEEIARRKAAEEQAEQWKGNCAAIQADEAPRMAQAQAMITAAEERATSAERRVAKLEAARRRMIDRAT